MSPLKPKLPRNQPLQAQRRISLPQLVQRDFQQKPQMCIVQPIDRICVLQDSMLAPRFTMVVVVKREEIAIRHHAPQLDLLHSHLTEKQLLFRWLRELRVRGDVRRDGSVVLILLEVDVVRVDMRVVRVVRRRRRHQLLRRRNRLVLRS